MVTKTLSCAGERPSLAKSRQSARSAPSSNEEEKDLGVCVCADAVKREEKNLGLGLGGDGELLRAQREAFDDFLEGNAQPERRLQEDFALAHDAAELAEALHDRHLARAHAPHVPRAAEATAQAVARARLALVDPTVA